MNLLEISIMTSAIVTGIKIVTDKGMIFAKIGAKLEILSNKRGFMTIMKPLYSCHYCMASVYSVIGYLLFRGVNLNMIIELPLMMLTVCCFNGVLHNLGFKEYE